MNIVVLAARSEQLGELGYPHISRETRKVLIALLLLLLIAYILAHSLDN